MPNTRIHLLVGTSFVVLALVAWLYFVYPMQREAAGAIHWEAVPATVTASAIRSSDKGAASTYRLEIAYLYRYRGAEYRGDRYGFSEVATSERARYEAALAAYPAGAEAVCYVNPQHPEQAVLNRDTPQEFYAVSGILAIPFLIGVFILLLTEFKRRRYLRATASA